MPRSMCDFVMMSVSKADAMDSDDAAVEVTAHLETCASCREALQRKFAWNR